MADPITVTMTRSTTTDPWVYGPIEIGEAGNTKTYTFQTQNKFLDGNIAVYAHANAVGALNFSIDNLTATLSMGTPSNGVYSPSVSLVGHVTAASAGWMTTNSTTVTDNSVAIGKVNQSTLKLGSNAATTGTSLTVTPTESQQSVAVSAGYNAARTITIKSMDAGTKATVKSGTASITNEGLTFTYNSDSSNYTVTAKVDVTSPTVPTSGYISSSTGTKNANNGQTVTSVVDKIRVGVTQIGTFNKTKPVIERTAKGTSDTWIDAAAGSGTTVTANKPYVRVDAAAISTTLTVRGKVTSAGYGTSTTGTYYTDTNDFKPDVGTTSADPVYIPIKEATIASPDLDITINGPEYISASGNFKVSVSGTVDAPTITTEGYISSNTNVGTKTAGTYNGLKSLSKIKVGVTATTPNIKVTPVINSVTKGTSSQGWIDALSGAAGAATTTEPSSGPYIKVYTPAIAKTTSVTGKVSTAGYGTTTSGQYSTDNSTTITGGTNAATAAYIPIVEAATFSLSVASNTGIVGSSELAVGGLSGGYYSVTASNLSVTATFSAGTYGWLDSAKTVNCADVDSVKVGKIPKATFNAVDNKVVCNGSGYITSGDTALGTITAGTITAVTTDPGSSYTNNTAVVIPSGGWLKITAGYYPNTRISLATLVPNNANVVTISNTSAQILSGVTVYDNNGALITGTIPTYNGVLEIA